MDKREIEKIVGKIIEKGMSEIWESGYIEIKNEREEIKGEMDTRQ